MNIELPENLLPNKQSQNNALDIDLFIENKHKEFAESQSILEKRDNEIAVNELNLQSTDESQINEDLDQNMFDPKKLLECFQNTNDLDEVIPPPLQYCDDLTDTDIYDDILNTYNTERVKEFDNNNNSFDELLSNNNSRIEKNVFGNSTGPTIASINMSTSQEIETWTISPEEKPYDVNNSNYYYHNFSNPAKCFTVMRTNFSSSNDKNTGTEKLNNFKFKKQKYEYKK